MNKGLRHIRLRTKVVGLFVLIFFFSSLVGFVLVRELVFTNREFLKVSEETLPVIRTIEDLRFATLRIVSSTNEFGFIMAEKRAEESPDGQESVEREFIEKGRELFNHALNEYERYSGDDSPEGQEQLARLKQYSNALFLHSSEILDAKAGGESNETVLEIKEKFEDAEKDLLSMLQGILQREMSKFETRKQLVNQALLDAILAIVIVTCVGFIVILCSGLLASKFIINPIKGLRDATAEIGKGNLDTRVDTSLHDEIGDLARSFNEMADSIRAAQDQANASRRSFQEQSEFLLHVINSIPYPFFVVNISDFSVRMANSALSASREWEKMRCFEMMNNMDIPCIGSEHKCALEMVRLTKEPFVTECLHHNKTGEARYYEIHAYPVFDAGGSVSEIIEYSIDITESKRAEIELHRTADMLRQSNEELRHFLFIASHDLREPLRKLMVFGDRLQGKYMGTLDGQGHDYMERMKNATRRMQALIDALQTYTRITTDSRPFVPVDISATVQDVLQELKDDVLRTGAHVETEDLPAVEADRVQMHQLFRNIISNSLKFRKNGETPVIKIHASRINNGSHQGTTMTGSFQITVEDNGIGFEEKYAEKIFGVFQRLHGRNDYEGTGIGLSVCRKIVERHGGRISAKGEPGVGTTVTVTLPASNRTDAAVI